MTCLLVDHRETCLVVVCSVEVVCLLVDCSMVGLVVVCSLEVAATDYVMSDHSWTIDSGVYCVE